MVVLCSLTQSVILDPTPTRLFRLGLGAAHALDHSDVHGPIVYALLPRGLNTNWLALRTGAHVDSIATANDLIAAQIHHPDASILVDCDQLRSDLIPVCRRRSPDPHSDFGGRVHRDASRRVHQARPQSPPRRLTQSPDPFRGNSAS